MSWIQKLQERWKVGSATQVLLILVVFACTGFTVVFLKRPVLTFFFGAEERPLYASVIYYILILPVYNIFLLFYGLLFGQFRFFWEFEKKFLKRITANFSKNKN